MLGRANERRVLRKCASWLANIKKMNLEIYALQQKLAELVLLSLCTGLLACSLHKGNALLPETHFLKFSIGFG
jgi:hypothetical protein